MSRPVVAVVVATVLVATLAATPALGAHEEARLQTPDRFDETTFRITVYQNGSATWAIEHQTALENDSQVAQFETYATAFETNDTELYLDFVEDAGLLTQYGTNETGRQMTVRNFERSAAVAPVQSRGTVRMAFLWTNFANTTGQRVVVSDVFEGGFYVGSSQSLVFERGPTLAFSNVRPAPDTQSQPDSLMGSETVSWIGERSFNDSRPYVELQPRSTVQTGTDVTTTAGGGAENNSMWQLAILVLVVALGAVAAAAWRSGGAAAIFGSDSDSGTATDAVSPTETQTAAEPAVTDEELLSDSDRVLSLLEENGGRMKQVDIVETTDWSKSKVSMLLSDMEDDGEISKLRVGRENIISLSGHEPDAAGSPFDDE